MKIEEESTETMESTKPRRGVKAPQIRMLEEAMIKKIVTLKETTVMFVPATEPYFVATFSTVGIEISLKISIKDEELTRDMIKLMSKDGLVSPEKIDIFDPETRKRFLERAEELEWNTEMENIEEQLSRCGVPKDFLGPIEEMVSGVKEMTKAAKGFEREISEAFAKMKDE